MSPALRYVGRGSSPALALCLLALLTTPAVGDVAPTCDGHWRAYPTHLGRTGNALSGAAVLNTHDAWAVGYQQPSDGTQDPLIEHWDGIAWGPVAVPDVAGPSNVLNDVDALAADDAWAVGRSLGHGADSTLILHWDGTTWSIVPGATGVDGRLFGVSMVAADDVWAVGTQNVGDRVETLAEHWDGSSWSVVPTPDPGHNFNYLFGVSAASSTAVLAAGYRQGLYTNSTLIERWDGSRWRVVPVRRRGTLGGVWSSDGHGSRSTPSHHHALHYRLTTIIEFRHNLLLTGFPVHSPCVLPECEALAASAPSG